MKAKTVLALLLGAVIVFSFAACAPKTSQGSGGKLKIGVSLPTLREERWVEDYNGFIDAAEKYGVEIIIQVADNNAARQQSQVENLITMGVKALIVAPQDSVAAKQLVELAHREKIPIIAYDRPITDGGADLLIETDQFQIGKLMGDYLYNNVPSGNIVFLKGCATDDTVYSMVDGTMSVIQSRVNDGTYKIVYDQFVTDWDNAAALRHMENALTANRNDIQGVMAHNDGIAGAAIQAMAAHNLRVPVTGQDCEVDAIVRIIAGTQGMTILYDNAGMADAAIDSAIKLINKQDSGATGKADDGTPVRGFPPLEINRNNYQKLLIDSGRFDADDFH
ncbi:MAG: substrate-binding domain-containing protein [Treponema sp.]|jgi:D-xylose transport system substrate-binding protein|nr:substrate-binding domain-containing protein [Treponema sp.]